jgi:hypothetical protein
MAVSVNNGKMPIYVNNASLTPVTSSIHKTFQNFNEVNKPYLCDLFRIGEYYYSIGDFFIIIFQIICLVFLLNLFLYKFNFYKNFITNFKI